MATLTAHELRSQGHVTGPIALVSFASPRVGFGQFRAHFASQFPQGAWSRAWFLKGSKQRAAALQPAQSHKLAPRVGLPSQAVITT